MHLFKAVGYINIYIYICLLREIYIVLLFFDLKNLVNEKRENNERELMQYILAIICPLNAQTFRDVCEVND